MGEEILFEYGYIPWHEAQREGEKFTKGIILYADGKLCKILRPVENRTMLFGGNFPSFDEKWKKEWIIFISTGVAKKVADILTSHEKEIQRLPHYLYHSGVLDGCEEFLRLGAYMVSRHNLFAEFPYKTNTEVLHGMADYERENEIGMELISRLYQEIQHAIGKIPFFHRYEKTSEWELLPVSGKDFSQFLEENDHFRKCEITNLDYAKQADILILSVYLSEGQYVLRLRFEKNVEVGLSPFEYDTDTPKAGQIRVYIGCNDMNEILWFDFFLPDKYECVASKWFMFSSKEISVRSNQSDFW